MNDVRQTESCARCRGWFRAGELRTRLYIAEDPDGDLGLSGTFHDQCAVPVWEFVAPTADRPALHG